MSTDPMSIEHLSGEEARRRIVELDVVGRLAHRYSRVKRVTQLEDGSFETDGDHVVHLGVMAIAYALKYRPDLDPGQVALYVLLHDLDEALAGDTSTLGANDTALAEKNVREAEARLKIEELLHDFPELIELLRSTTQLNRPEYSFGKAFDKLVPGYVHGGTTLAKHGINSYETLLQAVAATDRKMAVYASGHPDLLAMRNEMHKRVAENSFE